MKVPSYLTCVVERTLNQLKVNSTSMQMTFHKPTSRKWWKLWFRLVKASFLVGYYGSLAKRRTPGS